MAHCVVIVGFSLNICAPGTMRNQSRGAHRLCVGFLLKTSGYHKARTTRNKLEPIDAEDHDPGQTLVDCALAPVTSETSTDVSLVLRMEVCAGSINE